MLARPPARSDDMMATWDGQGLDHGQSKSHARSQGKMCLALYSSDAVPVP
jgi:hypothetical protein